MTLDGWFRVQADIARVITPGIVAVFYLVWIVLGSFVFRNVFVGVMGTSSIIILSGVPTVPFFADVHCAYLTRCRVEGNTVKNFEAISDELSALRKKEDADRFRKQKMRQLDAALSRLQRKSVVDSAGTGYAWQMKSHEEQSSLIEGRVSWLVVQGFAAERGVPSRGSHAHRYDTRATRRLHPVPYLDIRVCLVVCADEYLDFHKWDEMVKNVFQKGLKITDETVWPRDSLFRYFQLMSLLQENLKEFQELNLLASTFHLTLVHAGLCVQ